ncbi:energy-coupling factor transporter transmembrane component T [Sinomonas sp. B1-1]|uniref:energy-coupling factor transporter transmembrane component T n=1 Tax=Sinomonas sp. B1-1 TaxID=3141454 RepID=UPI003D2728A8
MSDDPHLPARDAPGSVNPLTGLALAAAALVLCFAVAHWAVWAGTIVLAAAASARAGTLGRVAVAAGVVVAPFALWALVIHGSFFPEGRTVLLAAGPLRVTAEGLAYAGSFVLRTAAAVAVMLAFSLWVDVAVLRAALVRRRVPPQLGYVLAASLGLAGVVGDRLRRIREAQEARGLVVGAGPGSRLLAARLQIVPLVLGLLDEAGERAMALDARGQTLPGPRTSYVDEPDSAAQRALRWALVVTAGAAAVGTVVAAVAGTTGG